MRPHTSHRYPFQTHYQRPQQRKFWVWRCRVTHYRRDRSAWRWCCTLCEPPTYGFRTRPDAWFRIMTISMPNHMRRLRQHHQFVARHKPEAGRA